MEPVSLQDHLKKIQSMGGKALLKKKGRAYFSKLSKKGWAKKNSIKKKKP
jgi:hypothetical protein